MRLIDADAWEEYFYEHMDDLHMEAAKNALDEMPTIDAVEVVRCKECIYWWESHEMCERNKNKNHHCACMNCDADFFCKNGERKE